MILLIINSLAKVYFFSTKAKNDKQNKEVKDSGRFCKVNGISNKNKNLLCFEKLPKLQKFNWGKTKKSNLATSKNFDMTKVITLDFTKTHFSKTNFFSYEVKEIFIYVKKKLY